MKCQDVSKELMSYLDRKPTDGGKNDVEAHLAGCADCRIRASEFREVWGILDEVPAVEPSFGFDARVRQRVAAEPRRPWFRWFVLQPVLAFSAALLILLTVWLVKSPINRPQTAPTVASTQQEDFNAIKDLGVLENYDVVTKMDALSELAPSTPQQPAGAQPGQQSGHNNGGV